MARPVLYVGNQNYSSWSLRPYMALAQAGIPFDLKLIKFGEPNFSRAVRRISPAGRVPVLVDGAVTVWDSLAILEYAAERWPKAKLWPATRLARTHARAISAEMHSGFMAIRNACPMNLRRPPKPIPLSDDVLMNVRRIEEIWADARRQFGKGGPFLFGRFCNADAMFAPVATRINTYDIKVSRASRAYIDAITSTKAFQTWLTAALKETWIEPQDEVD